MVLVLTAGNFLDYLAEIGLEPPNRSQVTTQTISARNFNLVVRCPGTPTLLLKQATTDQQGRNQLFQESQLQQLVASLPELDDVRRARPKSQIFSTAPLPTTNTNTLSGFMSR